jgi:hypothetical protein
MATAAHRARDRGASGDGRSLSESGRDRGAAAGAWGRRPPAKPANENEVTTGSDAAKPTHTINPNPNPENLSNKEKAKPANANAVTTGFGVESTGLHLPFHNRNGIQEVRQWSRVFSVPVGTYAA